MKLKRVKIVGFKTFADKTEFEINGDVIAVVGPNGCGKSNIVDAVLWGLGESNSRHLRAQTSQDVIFGGSQRRKSQSYAEVTLVFDNEDGALPVDAPEVAVTRRLNRAGESDYSINRQSCRLKDVTELLADSGLGRAGYAIVGQSDIDQALAASPHQRRAWIDEAAGVQRYRIRRVDALRRLEQCALHLERVADIVQEIETQREPLRAEAQVAQRYKSVLASLREIEVGILSREVTETTKEVADQTKNLQSVNKLSDDQVEAIIQLEGEAVVSGERASRLEAEADELRAAQQRLLSASENNRTNLEVAQTKRDGLSTLEDTLKEEHQRSGARIAEIERDLQTARAEAEAEGKARDALRDELGGADGAAKDLAQRLRQLEGELTAARLAAEAHHRASLERAHRAERLSHLQKEMAGVESAVPDLESGVAEAEAQVAEVDARLGEHDADIRTLDEQMAQARARDHLAQQETRRLLSELANLEGRRRAVESTIAAHEGLAQGPKAVLEAVRSGHLADVYLPVSEAIEADSELALAIDTALGASANDLICPDDDAAKRAIEHLKRNRLGRATFQPVVLMRAPTPSRELDLVLKSEGVVGIASRLVVCDETERPVVDSLLGRVVVVENLDQALKLARTHGWSRLVTLAGEVVFASGAVTGGVQARQVVGTVQRRAELAGMAVEAEAAQSRVAQLAAESEAVEQDRARWEAERTAGRTRRDELRKRREEAAGWLASLRHELQNTRKSGERLAAERERLTSDLPVMQEPPDCEALERIRDALVRDLGARSSDAEKATGLISEADARATAAAARLKELERRAASADEAEKHRQKRADNLGPERDRLTQLIESSTREVERLEALATQTRANLEVALSARSDAINRTRLVEEQIREAQRAVNALNDSLHRAELARARAEARKSAALERLLEEYGLNEVEAAKAVEGKEVPPDAGPLANRLRRELKEMGDVNLGAVEAFERLEARHAELTGQTEDIQQGKRDVEESIRELDRLTRDRFVTTFKAVQEAFAQSFREMFGDGEGSLELEDSENILDSGVEISVQVPGKKRQRLELLSGGERALSAIAFLFALIRVKPTPLVVLDEVDAPLDGRNVERFIGIMKSLSSSVQFILITHNPVTIESADVWFGVTMQEPGVSTLVPVRVPDRKIVQAVVSDSFLKPALST